MSGEIEVTLAQLLDEVNGEELTLARINQLLRGITVRVSADAVTGREIADGTIGADKLESDISAQIGIPNDSISTAKIVDRAVTGDKIALDGVAAVNVASDVAGDGLTQAAGGALDVNVDNVSLETSGDAVQVKDDGVTTAKIADANVTLAKLAAGAKAQVLQAVKDDAQEIVHSAWREVSDLTTSITPASTSNKVLVVANVSLCCLTSGSGVHAAVRVLRDGSPIGVGEATPIEEQVGVAAFLQTGTAETCSLVFLDSPASVAAVEYTLEVYHFDSGDTQTLYVNRHTTDSIMVFHASSTLTLQEVQG